MKNELTIASLKSMLIAVGGVKSNSWDVVRAIQEGISLNTIAVKEKKWFDEYHQRHTELKLDQLETWSASEGGIELRFRFDQDVLMCHAIIYEHMHFSKRYKEKFEAWLMVPEEFIVHIGGVIKSAFANELERQHDDFLDAQRRKWKQDRANEIIGSEEYKVQQWE